MNESVYVYLPYPSYWVPMPHQKTPYRTIRLRLRRSVYLEAIETMAWAMARRGDLDAYIQCGVLLQQTVRFVSHYFHCANPHDAESWAPLLKAIIVEQAWIHDAVQLYILQSEPYQLPHDPAVREHCLEILRKLTEKRTPIESWPSVRDEYVAKDGIVTIDDLMSLPNNIPPPIIGFDADPAGDASHIEPYEESIESVQYLYRCLSPKYLRWVARRIADEVVEAIGPNTRGVKSSLGASILFACKVAVLPSIRRTWLPEGFQPFYSLKATDRVRHNLKHNPASAPQPNMAMVAAILAQIAGSR
ncbi:MAG: hypothetical protein KatS3mg040_1085 [Candidatus Kapaibacterium sp.]|nr:MAG: hypothetical protein KatS3mg040_1085 [Candidatus Kapabacteria bacterium]